MSRPDYILDLASRRDDQQDHQRDGKSGFRGRPWLAIHWRCCSVYSRVYRNAAGTAYAGRCPRCGKAVSVKVGEGGTDSRFFEAR